MRRMQPAIDMRQFKEIVRLAREEDLAEIGDLTTLLLPEDAYRGSGAWWLTARQAGRFCGRELLNPLLAELAPELKAIWLGSPDGPVDVQPGDRIARLTGLACQMLAAERTILNFLQHLSGVATLTARFVRAVAGTHAKIYDTRKTTPGLRSLEKYAVRCGGGHSHRYGLYDAVLIKDNHLAGVPIDRLAHRVFEMLNRLERLPARPAFVEVECDTLEQFAELTKVVGIDVVLLDNFPLEWLREAVRMRDRQGLRGKLELEASGGASLETVRPIAETGVDRIAVGAITHSAPILDLAIDAA